MTSKLEQKVDSLESKVHSYERGENLDEQVRQARSELQEYNRELRELNTRLEDLEHFSAILRDVFDNDVPDSVDDIHHNIAQITERRQEDILELLKKEQLGDKRREVREKQDEVKSATAEAKRELEDVQSEWQQRVSTARSVLKIAGGSRSFESTLDDLDEFIGRDIWKTSERITTIDSRWQGLKKAWDKEAVDWKSFQNTHGLNDETIEVLQKLSRGEAVRVGRVDSAVLEDMNRVDQLGNNIELTI